MEPVIFCVEEIHPGDFTDLSHGVGLAARTFPVLAHSGWIHAVTACNIQTQSLTHCCGGLFMKVC